MPRTRTFVGGLFRHERCAMPGVACRGLVAVRVLRHVRRVGSDTRSLVVYGCWCRNERQYRQRQHLRQCQQSISTMQQQATSSATNRGGGGGGGCGKMVGGQERMTKARK